MGNGRTRWFGAPLAAVVVCLTAGPFVPSPGQAQEVTRHGTAAGTPATDWRIVVLQRPMAEQPTDQPDVTPKADGQFDLQVPGGAPLFLCPYIDGRLAPDSIVLLRAKPNSALPERFDFGPKPPRARVDLALQREDGTALPAGTRVHLYNTYGELLGGRDVPTLDGRGAITFERLPCTLYDLWVEGDGDLASAVLHGLAVQAGDGTQTIGLKAARAGSVRGTLVAADGAPLPEGSSVSLQTGTVPDDAMPLGQRPADYARGALVCYAESAVTTDGSFALHGLTPGRHSLDVRMPGQVRPSFSVTGVEVKTGAETDLGTVQLPRDPWEFMFDRRTLDGWRESGLYGQREVYVAGDRIMLEAGNDMTGITWEGALPRIDYEVSLQGMRVAGSDFFCGLTFPVNDACCSLIMGGWGGSLVGLSCLNGMDASENEFSTSIDFDEQRWYRIRLKVTAARITAWLDDRVIVDAPIEGRRLSTRWEVEKCEPFGLSTWRTTGAIRDIRIRRLGDAGPQP